MAKKFYAIKLNNGEEKVLTNWSEAQQFIATCPSNAKYKGFGTLDDAKLFLAKLNGENPAKNYDPESGSEFSHYAPGTAVAFVDGSFNQPIETWGYGVVLFDAAAPEIKTELKGKGNVHADSMNVTGEIYAAMKAVQTAIKMGFKAVVIYHDYQGIASWAEGEWMTRQELTRSYAKYMNDRRKNIEIKFVKVSGHTGVELNERADTLAKIGCGVLQA